MARSLAFKSGSLPVGAVLTAIFAGACILLIPGAAASQVADLSISNSDLLDPVTAGSDVVYTITVDNAGPDAAADVSWSDSLPNLLFTSLTAPAGWSCTTPPVGRAGQVSCSIASLPVGSTVFTIAAEVFSVTSPGTEISNTATVSSTTGDPDVDDLSATEITLVRVLANVSASMTAEPDPVTPGSNLTYTITLHNGGPSNADVKMTDPLPAGTTLVSFVGPPWSPLRWECVFPWPGTNGSVECFNAQMPPGDVVITLVVKVDAAATPGTVIENSAVLVSKTPSDVPFDGSFSALTTVGNPIVHISGSKTVSGTFKYGGTIVYTVVLGNNGSAAQGDDPGDEFTDKLPVLLTPVAVTATSGTAGFAYRTVTWNGSIAPGGSVTITITTTFTGGAPPGWPVPNQGTIFYDADGDGTNETLGLTDDPHQDGTADPTLFYVGSLLQDIPSLDWRGMVALIAVLAALGVAWLRRG